VAIPEDRNAMQKGAGKKINTSVDISRYNECGT
jgi:hypothetical protein